MNQYAKQERDERRKRIVEALDSYALKVAAKDAGLGSHERDTFDTDQLREFVLSNWSDCEDAIFRYLDGAKD